MPDEGPSDARLLALERRILDQMQENQRNMERLLDALGEDDDRRLQILQEQTRTIGTLVTIMERVEKDQERYWTLINRVIVTLFALLVGVLAAIGLFKGSLP